MECSDFGKFTLLNHMGKGGVANVYRANDNEHGNIVAVKIFETDERRSADTVRRLRDREVQMLISIQHPNVVKYYESGDVDESYYYTMEFVENSLLERMHGPNDLELEDKIHILRQSCNALQAIHHQGIVHRDIKPGNILLDQDPSGAIHVKVTDLGIAKHVSETDSPRDKSNSKVPGTPKYLSPEQIQLKSVDGRADIFSLGVVAYEMLAGSKPFEARTSEEYLRANLKETPSPVHHVNEDMPAFLNPMVERMLAKEREQRYDSDTLARDLELTYQHLVSKAPLVERRNRESVYYVPPVSSQEEDDVKEEVATWWRYPIALGMVLLAAIVVALKWPQMPENEETGPPPDLSRPQMGSPGDILADARRLVGGNNYWEASALLSGLETEELNQAQINRRDQLQETIHTHLAESVCKWGGNRLEEGRFKEARVMVEKINDLFPKSTKGEQLEQEITEYEERLAQQKKWQQTMDEIQESMDDENYAEAIEKAGEVAAGIENEDHRKMIRDLIVSTAEEWQRRLFVTGANYSEIQEYLNLIEQFEGRDWFQKAMDVARPQLEVKIAEGYAQAEEVDEAMQRIDRVIKKYPNTRASDEARDLRERLTEDGLLGPVDLTTFAEQVRDRGFEDSIWSASVPENGKQVIRNGILIFELNNEEASAETRNRCRNVRPIRPGLGFDLSVEFRADSRNMGDNAEYKSGIKVEGRRGNAISVGFDGTSYELVQSSGGSSGGRKLRSAFGDEGEKWHELAVRYQYDTGRVYVRIDGEELGTRRLDLMVFDVELFLELNGQGRTQAAFRNLQCR